MEFKVGDKVDWNGIVGFVILSRGVTIPLKVQFEELVGQEWFTLDGRVSPKQNTPVLKLIDRPKIKVKKSGWINIVRYSNHEAYPSSNVYEFQSDALYAASRNPHVIDTVEIHWERDE